MNEEIKEQVYIEFDEKFEHAGIIGDRTFKDYLPNTYENILNFIDSLIDKTVQMERERIVGVIENIHTKHYIPEHFNPIENREHLGYRKAQMDIKNYLITNKSDINK